MQQGAGGGDVDPVGESEERAEGGQRLLQVVDPDVAAVDDTGDQPFPGQPADGGQRVEVGGGGLGEVHGETFDGGLCQDRQSVAEPVEVGGQEQLGPVGAAAQVAVGALGGVQLRPAAVLHQRGFVELHPLGTGRAQVGEHLGVHGQQPVQQGQRFEAGRYAGGRLGEQEVGDGADQHGPGGVALGEGFPQFGDLLGGVRGEDGVRAEFRDEVVVVGVEPLRHLQRSHVLGAARHGEVAVGRVGVDGGAVPLGDRADHDGGVEDVVVVREVAGGHLVDTGVGEPAPGAAAQLGRGPAEGVGADAALPVPLDGLLELPVGSLAGVAVHGGPCCRGCGLRCHGDLLREMNP